ELKASGLGNFLCGCLGAVPGYAFFSMSILSYEVGATSRVVGFTTAIVCALAIFYGAPLLGLIPKLVLGAMLFYIGWNFIYEWAGKKSLARFTIDEKIIVALVSLSIIFVGLLEGLAVGILGGLIIFAVNYSRTDVVKYALSGSAFHSHVARSSDLRHYLMENGNVIYILKLQSFIFFGTANMLYGRVKKRVEDSCSDPLRLIIMDFRSVTGMDSSAVLTFKKMILLAEKNNFLLLFSDLSPHIRDSFERGEVEGVNNPCVRFFPDLDFAIEWAENELLNEVYSKEEDAPVYLQDELSRSYPDSKEVPILLSYMNRVEFKPNEHMITQNTYADEMFFIESGEVSVQMDMDTGKVIRLRKMGAGAVVGELTFYLGRARTASVVTNEKTIAYQLSRADLAQMRVKDPQASALLHEFIANMLAERLIETVDLLKEVTD
ncbi:MAG: SulP family sulfate permease, partial [Chlamydiales bacterium]